MLVFLSVTFVWFYNFPWLGLLVNSRDLVVRKAVVANYLGLNLKLSKVSVSFFCWKVFLVFLPLILDDSLNQRKQSSRTKIDSNPHC